MFHPIEWTVLITVQYCTKASPTNSLHCKRNELVGADFSQTLIE